MVWIRTKEYQTPHWDFSFWRFSLHVVVMFLNFTSFISRTGLSVSESWTANPPRAAHLLASN